jgi:hypothetical protein
MVAKYLLYFTGESHCLYRSRGRSLELNGRFPANDQGLGAFREHLRGCRRALFSVLADVPGEAFHEDQIPFLRGEDRKGVVQRRLAQRYRDTRLAAALSLGYVAGERRNERLLLASFTGTQQFAPWLDALETAGARLVGVYSVPLLAPALAAALGSRGGHCFVVTANRAGLRQSFLDQGRLRFARLESTAGVAPEALAAFVRSETQRLAQYLVTLRALPRDGPPVQVLAVTPAGQHAAFARALVSDARLAFHAVDAAEAARAAGLSRLPEGTAAEGLYLQLCARKAPREQFASREERRRFHLWQLQRAVLAAGALGLAACGLYAGTQWLTAAGVRGQAVELQREARLAAEQYQRITAGFPVTQTTTENLRAAVLGFQRIAAGSATPESAFVHVAKVLELFPQIELEALEWKTGRAEAPGAKPGATPLGAAKPAAGGGTAIVLELSGRVNATQRDDYRGITAQVQQFAETLAATSGYERLRMQLPFDITSEGTLTGDIGERGSGDAPRFTVVLAGRLP